MVEKSIVREIKCHCGNLYESFYHVACPVCYPEKPSRIKLAAKTKQDRITGTGTERFKHITT